MTVLVRAAALTNYAQVAQRTGLDPNRMLHSVGLDRRALANPDLRVAAEKVAALLEKSERDSHCLTFGLQMAESRRLSDFGALSLLLTHQRTMREVLTTTIEYLHVLNESLALTIEDSGELVIVREEIVTARALRQATELAVGVLFRMFRTVLGPRWKPYSVNFVHAAPPDLSVHRRVFGTTPVFGAEFSGIVCEGRDLDRPNPSADPEMARYAKQFVEAMPGASRRSIVQEVKKAIYLLLPQGRATIEQVAAGLGVNVRALQRQLSAAGEVYSDLLDDVRQDLAERYLENDAHSITEIGAMLGFSHSSAFSRWYRSQFGVPPANARKRRDKRP
ncbi:MAG TPA: AraC family transcriptional regulator [Rhizomicrobium sp.]|nr:AraC family transcriptional regulator [Rhizomicrobium sp.]